MRVLLIEDDPMIGRAVMAGLQEGGYMVDWVRDGVEAELALGHHPYDLALLDLGLPRLDGLEVLQNLRSSGNNLPVLVITARDAVADRIAGLDRGADDYLVKPFDLDELLARARAVIRRKGGRPGPGLTCGALALDPASRLVSFRGAPVELSPREFAVLEALMKDPGAVVSREKLEDAVYGWEEDVGSNSIEVHLHHLRRKLSPELIRNVRGVGYRIVALQ
jgi:DNA-binding response OmpR family regulator